MDSTRTVLLQVARTITRVPEGCSVSAWTYLTLMAAVTASAECRDAWHVLAAAETDRGGASPTPAQETEPSTLDRHLEAHPNCRTLLEGYRRYLRLPGDLDLAARSGWTLASQDLDHYLEAQFGDAHPQALRGGRHWRQFLPIMPWGRSRAVGAAVVVGALVLAVLLWRAWHVRDLPLGSRGSAADSARVTPARTIPLPPETTPLPIAGARAERQGREVVFHWDRFPGIHKYRVLVLTAKIDTVFTAEDVLDPPYRLAMTGVPELRPNAPFLFRVDGLSDDKAVCSSGFVPFTIPEN